MTPQPCHHTGFGSIPGSDCTKEGETRAPRRILLKPEHESTTELRRVSDAKVHKPSMTFNHQNGPRRSNEYAPLARREERRVIGAPLGPNMRQAPMLTWWCVDLGWVLDIR